MARFDRDQTRTGDGGGGDEDGVIRGGDGEDFSCAKASAKENDRSTARQSMQREC